MSESRKPMRLVGVHIEHPHGHDHARGAVSTAHLSVDRGLKSGRLDAIPMTESDLLKLAHDALRVARILRGDR